MSIQQLVGVLHDYIETHQQLKSSANRKTEALKKGDFAALDDIVREEQVHVAMLNQLEKKRARIVTQITGIDGEQTVESCLRYADEQEQKILHELRQQLLQHIEELKRINELNQQLIEQSLQFVCVMLDALHPQRKDIQYRANNEPTSYEERQSIFDSKV